MRKRLYKGILGLGTVVLVLAFPYLLYSLEGLDEHSPVADGLRKLSVSSEHVHASIFKLEHRRHYEVFDFDTSYDKIKPKLKSLCIGAGWTEKDDPQFVEFLNEAKGRVNFVRLAKNQAIGMFGDLNAKPPKPGDKPWAVVMYRTTWLDREFSDESLFPQLADLVLLL
jgi:hypothetical protein